jgi:hypothetical protein
MKCACAILSSVACPALPGLPAPSNKQYDFRKSFTERKMWFDLILSITFVWNVSHSEKKVLSPMYTGLCEQCPHFCHTLKKLRPSPEIFEKSTQMSNFIKLLPVGAELFHADRRTDGEKDMKKPIVAFRNFANAPTNQNILVYYLFPSYTTIKIKLTLYLFYFTGNMFRSPFATIIRQISHNVCHPCAYSIGSHMFTRVQYGIPYVYKQFC